jgi:glycosyltransferase involved in cell wall biosynthesis
VLTVSRPAPPISVVLPAYNAEATLEQAVGSVLNQHEGDFELVLVDDGSTDRTAEAARALADRDRRLRLELQPHRGIVAALNHGLSRSRGELIARMDADDVSYPDRLGAQRRYLCGHPEAGLVACRVDFGGEGDRDRGYARHVAWTNTLTTHDQIALNRFVESPVAHPSVMFRRALLAFGGYREGPFPEDYELWLRWLELGVRMAKLPDTLLRWNDPPERLSRSDPRCSIEAFYACKTGYLARWLAAHNPHHPEVTVWGAGRTSRKRAALLGAHGIRIVAFLDIDPAKVGQTIEGRPVLAPEALGLPDEQFVLPYVGSWNARETIEAWLQKQGFVAGRHYICAA